MKFVSVAVAFALFILIVRALPTNLRAAADIMESPYIAQIRDRNGNLICSGAILNFLYILTTASCVNKYEITDLTIVVGTANLEDGTSYYLSQIIIHEGYCNGENDIAMLKLSSYMRYSTSVRPSSIREIWEEEDLEDNSSAVVSGWGDFSTLRRTDQTINSIADCNESYANIGTTITGHHICAATINPTEINERSSDNGSPLVQGTTLIGLKSWSVSGHPDVYTRIYFQLGWIEENNLE